MNEILRILISKLERETAERSGLSQEEALLHLWYLATRRAGDFVDENGKILSVAKMNPCAQACIDGLEQEVSVNSETGDETIKTKLRLRRWMIF